MNLACALMLSIFLLSGCSSLDKYKDEPSDILYEADIDADNRDEIIKVKDRFDTQSRTVIIALERNKREIGRISFPGRLRNLEFMELDIGPRKQISAHYIRRDGSEAVDIYSLKGDNFRKIFSIDSNCGIETDYGSMLARVKVGKLKCNGGDCYCIGPAEGDMWIWAGDRFVRER